MIRADARAVAQFGFDGVKLDGCGRYLDIDAWATELNLTGRAIAIENCHWGKCEDATRKACPTRQPDGSVHCPMHFFRTSGDIDSSMFSWLRNLETALRFLAWDAPLAGRGCWPYPDMLA